MASKITAAFVLVALLAFQGVESSIITEFEDFVRTAITSAIKSVQNVESQLETVIKKSISKAEERLEDALDVPKKMIEKAVSEANAAHVVVTECVNAGWKDLEDIRNNTRLNLAQCSLEARQAIDPDMSAAWGVVQKINSTTRGSLQNLTACHWNLPCMTDASIKGVLHINQVGIHLARTLVQIEDQVPQAVVEAAQCSEQGVNSALPQGQQVANSTVVCIRDKISDHSS